MNTAITRQTLGDRLRRTRMRFPDKLAIRCGKTDWTYAEFDDICNRLAGGLAAHGIDIPSGFQLSLPLHPNPPRYMPFSPR